MPVPPGNAINASPSSIIFVFLSSIFSVTISLVISSYCNSASTKNCGSTPVTSPPASNTLSAITPISPDLEPPYIRECPLSPIHVPSFFTSSANAGSFPSKAPRYTVMFIFNVLRSIFYFFSKYTKPLFSVFVFLNLTKPDFFIQLNIL